MSNATDTPARLEPTDAGNKGDLGGSGARRDFGSALRTAQDAQEIFAAKGAWRLAREIEDEIARWRSEENPPGQFCLVCEGLCRGEEAHGAVASDAQVKAA